MRPRKILIVEDDAMVADVVARYLERDEFAVEIVGDGRAALESARRDAPDLIVLDVMLPKLNGFEVSRRLRENSAIPIIMLTARGEESDRVMGLELGADDYVVKPFSPRELAARVKSVLRRTEASSAERNGLPEQIDVGPLQIDLRAHTVHLNGTVTSLTTLEFQLLVFFAQNPGRVFRREELLEQVWGYSFGGTSTVTVHVQRLREKIEPDPAEPMWIKTVWGVGYRFDPPVQSSGEEAAKPKSVGRPS